jgi:hypothetical protein
MVSAAKNKDSSWPPNLLRCAYSMPSLRADRSLKIRQSSPRRNARKTRPSDASPCAHSVVLRRPQASASTHDVCRDSRRLCRPVALSQRATHAMAKSSDLCRQKSLRRHFARGDNKRLPTFVATDITSVASALHVSCTDKVTYAYCRENSQRRQKAAIAMSAQ